MAFGQCKDMSIEFINGTGHTVNIPQEGHRVRNPGAPEGWNMLTLGTSITNLAPGASRSVRQTLNIKCSDDAEFEIHYGAPDDEVQIFTNENIENKNAILTLTHN
jgi:hypothetical protein